MAGHCDSGWTTFGRRTTTRMADGADSDLSPIPLSVIRLGLYPFPPVTSFTGSSVKIKFAPHSIGAPKLLLNRAGFAGGSNS